jgi:demethylmenaquinone methyltransferase/2-methoxy-6-polyprenyl-1,4-benzoquinol methylase
MIGTYSTNFGNAAGVAAMLREQGLEVEFSSYVFGCATGVAGRKIRPAGAPSTFSEARTS